MSLREEKGTKRQRRIKLAKQVAIGTVIFFSFAVLAKVADRPPRPSPDVIKKLEKIEGSQKSLKRKFKAIEEDIKELKDTTEAPKWLDDQTNRKLLGRRRILADRRGGNWIGRIDQYLAGTPLAGQGRAFFLAAVDNGLPPNLSVAIAARESGKGAQIPSGSYNPFGMTAGTAPGYAVVNARGPDGTRGYQAFPDWATAIKEHNKFIANHWGAVSGPRQMRGYAMDPAWANGVQANMGQI